MANHPELKGDRCPDCNGKGTVFKPLGVSTGKTISVEVDCTTCHGTGLVNSPNACKVCYGSRTQLVDFLGLKAEACCGHCKGSGLEPI